MKLLLLLVTLLVGTGATLAASNRGPFRSLHAPKGEQPLYCCVAAANNLLISLHFPEFIENYELVSPAVTFLDEKKVSKTVSMSGILHTMHTLIMHMHTHSAIPS